MKIFDILKYSGRSLKSQKWRSFLTILGVLIGIAAIVALTSLGNGFESTITGQLESGFATNTLIVSKKSGTFEQPDPLFNLYYENRSVFEGIDHIDLAMPVLQVTCNVSFGDDQINAFPVYGVDYNNYSYIFPSSFVAKEGGIPTNSSTTNYVVGSNIDQKVDLDDPIEITSIFGGVSHNDSVVAILEEIGGVSLGGGPTDNGIYLHANLIRYKFNIEIVSYFIVLLDDDADSTINSVSDAISTAFNDQVSVIASTAVLDTIQSAFGTIEVFLGGIAGISLIVAGIGIMNIMIVSLMERTREIGIIKALGMKNSSILLIFLCETIFIGLIGSLLGIGAGYLFASLFGRVLSGGAAGGGPTGGFGGGGVPGFGTISPIITLDMFGLAIFYGVLVSVIFGLYPAWRAARLEPVEALRYE
ncbi:MAG: FtsX-like permease family protein [Candidatus Lokiarchaeota archaeon]|nr:FtsX-like permease family protein [Candidatus Lokiarchaeota archaeon]MBD3199070.1 FtsX-like permease family protein [Candidatus Lokiarchaeota archaeon]